jgi:hypothetical protein
MTRIADLQTGTDLALVRDYIHPLAAIDGHGQPGAGRRLVRKHKAAAGAIPTTPSPLRSSQERGRLLRQPGRASAGGNEYVRLLELAQVELDGELQRTECSKAFRHGESNQGFPCTVQVSS